MKNFNNWANNNNKIDYKPSRQKNVIVFDDMIADIMSNKKS